MSRLRLTAALLSFWGGVAVPAWNTRALRRSARLKAARLKAKEQGADAMAAGFLASDEDSSEAGVDMESDSDR